MEKTNESKNLVILKSIKHSLNDVQAVIPNFNFRPGAGLCWHIVAYNSESGFNDIREVFKELGLDACYPVEKQLFSSNRECERAYCISNKYDSSTDIGKLRIKLLDDLISYYEKKVELVL